MGAAQPWARFYNPHAYAISATGAPSPGAKAYFYASGTTAPLTTYADQSLSTPNPNPVVADASGIFPDVFLQALSYRVVITDSSGNQLDFADPVSPFIQSQSVFQNSLIIEFTCDGNGNVVPAGKQGDQYVPIEVEITAAVCMANLPGSLACDVWVAPFAVNSAPTQQNSITSSDPVQLNSSISSFDNTLGGWQTTIEAGSQVRFNLESCSVITRFTIQLVCSPVAV